MKTFCGFPLAVWQNTVILYVVNIGKLTYRMAPFRLAGRLCALTALVVLTACSAATAPEGQRQQADSLNRLAYEYRYRDVARSQAYAEQAQAAAPDYADGQAEALNHLTYVRYQQMDFDGAERLVRQVQALTDNQIELLVADVMGMKICQRTAGNHDFFVYRNRARRRLERIAVEEQKLPEHLRDRLLFARTEYHIVSSTYYFYLEQREKALEEINQVKPDGDGGRRDTAQWLYLHYMKGSGGLCEGGSEEEIQIREFDMLFRCYTLSRAGSYLYFEGNSLQAMAVLFRDPATRARIRAAWPGTYDFLCGRHLRGRREEPDAEARLPLALAEQALQVFQAYDDEFQTACAYRTLGELMLYQDDYAAALRYFETALSYVNKHHRRYYPHSSGGLLRAFEENDTISREMQWMLSPTVKTVPAWIAGIREQMSVAFSAIGDKQKSDYNRNIYLDLLELTRQDKELESRYEELAADTRALSFWLFAVLVLILLLAGLFLWLSFRWKKNDRSQTAQLRTVLDYCRGILRAKGDEAAGVPLSADEALERVVQPFRDFARSNQSRLQEIGNERLQAQDERRLSEMRIAENKRENVEKRAKMALVHGIVPFLDRIIHEVHRLERSGSEAGKRLPYIDELVDKISEYNTILTQWIQLRQGQLSLHVERFELQPLFELLKKGRYAFEHKGIKLRVEDTAAAVKADKSLTLFMINTLADNARKFTPAGGQVTVAARECDAYVEVSVTDTGCGLSDEDTALLLSSQVYDAAKIGRTAAGDAAGKGSGFGLMNCKGIIEKYRKTSPLFGVCIFGVESRLGQGSRFFFRLPRSVRRTLEGAGLMLVLLTVGACSVEPSQPEADAGSTGAGVAIVPSADRLSARAFADSLYFANINGEYGRALAYADSACRYLNRIQAVQAGAGAVRMTLYEPDRMAVPAEVEWWEHRADLDYNLILGVRNEVAVAALALRDWSLYRYNNQVYTQLYRLISQDASLESYCLEMEKAHTNRRVSLALILLLTFVAVLAFYMLYFRKHMLFRFNVSQVLEINRNLLTAATDSREEEGDATAVVVTLLHRAWQGLNEVHGVSALCLLLHDDKGHLIGSYAEGEATAEAPKIEEWLAHTYRSAQPMHEAGKGRYTFPLWVEQADGDPCCIGALLFDTGAEEAGEAERLLDELVVRYLAMLLHQTVVRRRAEYEDLESAEDERARALYEEDKLHVQNLVLDNCLSAIKHESMYYPSRIKQMVGHMADCAPESAEQQRQIKILAELVHYYKEVYTLLCAQADRQLAETNFRRRAVPVRRLLAQAVRTFEKLCRKKALPYTLLTRQDEPADSVLGDEDLLHYLLENLMAGALHAESEATETAFRLTAETDGRFVRFRLSDPRPLSPAEDLNERFTPDVHRIPYLISKQIIREHDTFTNHCGCRIHAEPSPSGGCCVWFTIPLVSKTTSYYETV